MPDTWLEDLIDATYAWAEAIGHAILAERAWFHIGTLSGAEHELAYYA